ncbi:MAG TPA: MmcQ/YjbR family DNA-binding protein [Planctomycetota bacterium]|nr:MmcQ/YjbR family DNA-binding protein [Planctomycetota bacterium]
MITWDRVVAIALRLPGAASSTSYGRPAVKVGDKAFVCSGKQGDHFVLMAEREEAAALMASEPRTFFQTPHYKDSRAVLVRYRQADPQLVEVLLQRAWSRRASVAQRAALARGQAGS